MASFSMDQLRKEAGEPATVVLPSHSRNERLRDRAMGRVSRRTVDETKMLIKTCVLEARRAVTFLEICDYLERRPTPHLRGIVAELVRGGELLVEADDAPGGIMARFWYSLP